MKHYFKMGKALCKMRKSCFSNDLDLQNWKTDMEHYLTIMNEGASKFKIPISPLLHTLVHGYEFLINQQNFLNTDRNRGI